MNLHAFYHRTQSNYCYCYDEEEVHIRFRAAQNDLDQVILIYGDKFDWEKKQKINMELIGSDDLYDYFAAIVKPDKKRLAYFFEVVKGKEKLYYTEWGTSKEIDRKELHMHYFQYPYMHRIDMQVVPQWAKDAVFYQIFPERFNNGDPSISPANTRDWGEKPEAANFFGGDLKGIMNKLSYLEQLGINAIYLTPIFEAPTNHKYDTTDYYKIDPHFGDLNILKELVLKCHEKGIKVVLDAVFNHSGFFFAPFQDVIERGEESPYFDWFHIHKWPLKMDPPSYDTFAFASRMPKLNTENPEVKNYLLNVARYWIKEADIDGWRLDVCDEVDHEFWRSFRKTVKEAKPDAFIIGEMWLNSLPWLLGDQFDTVMNYPLTRNCLQYFAYNQISEKQFKESITKIQMNHMQQVNEVMFNLLDSHDTPRFLTLAGGNRSKLKLAAAFQMTYIGTPCIYYGTEVGMEGLQDPDCRRPMEWNEENWDLDLYSYYKGLIRLRRNHEALRKGNFRWIDTCNGIIGYIRETEKEKILVFINNHEKGQAMEIDIGCNKVKNALSEELLQGHEGKLSIEMEKYSVQILIVK